MCSGLCHSPSCRRTHCAYPLTRLFAPLGFCGCSCRGDSSPHSCSVGYILGRGISGSYRKSMFNFLRNRQKCFHSGCAILHSDWKYLRVSISPYPQHHLLISFFLKKNYSYSKRYEIVSHCGFDLHFLDD